MIRSHATPAVIPQVLLWIGYLFVHIVKGMLISPELVRVLLPQGSQKEDVMNTRGTRKLARDAGDCR